MSSSRSGGPLEGRETESPVGRAVVWAEAGRGRWHLRQLLLGLDLSLGLDLTHLSF